jgi:hypothetical protein
MTMIKHSPDVYPGEYNAFYVILCNSMYLNELNEFKNYYLLSPSILMIKYKNRETPPSMKLHAQAESHHHTI